MLLTVLLVTLQQKPIDAASLLKKVQQAYVDLKSSSDTGESTTTGAGVKGIVKFTTRYTRPNRLFFEYRKVPDQFFGGDRMVIWPGSRDEYRVWWTVKPEVQTTTIMMAIAGATGVSQSTAHTIPTLLMPTLMGNIFSSATSPKIMGTAIQDGMPCYRMAVTLPMGSATFWIDQKTKLIRRVDETTSIDPKQMRAMMDMAGTPEVNRAVPHQAMTFINVIVFRPTANPKLSTSVFAFTPPPLGRK